MTRSLSEKGCQMTTSHICHRQEGEVKRRHWQWGHGGFLWALDAVLLIGLWCLMGTDPAQEMRLSASLPGDSGSLGISIIKVYSAENSIAVSCLYIHTSYLSSLWKNKTSFAGKPRYFGFILSSVVPLRLTRMCLEILTPCQDAEARKLLRSALVGP